MLYNRRRRRRRRRRFYFRRRSYSPAAAVAAFAVVVVAVALSTTSTFTTTTLTITTTIASSFASSFLVRSSSSSSFCGSRSRFASALFVRPRTAATAAAETAAATRRMSSSSSRPETAPSQPPPPPFPSAPPSLLDFLVGRRERLAEELLRRRRNGNDDSDAKSTLHLVVGNEAGDADSVVSALTWAYADGYLADSNINNAANTNNNDDDEMQKKKDPTSPRLTVPVVSIPRRDFETQRPETTLLLRLAFSSSSSGGGRFIENDDRDNEDDGEDDVGRTADAPIPNFLDALVFVDDPVLLELLRPESSSTTTTTTTEAVAARADATLVDHNRAGDKLRRDLFGAARVNVVEIVDHHHDEGEHLSSVPAGSNKRNVAYRDGKALVASTCTLVAERLKEIRRRTVARGTATTTATAGGAPDASSPSHDGHDSSSTSFYFYPVDVATALLGTILLDSVNMSPEAGKGTIRDSDAIRDLVDNADWSRLSWRAREVLGITRRIPKKDDGGGGGDRNDDGRAVPDTTAFYEALQRAKFDVEFWKSLSIRDALRLDYKQFSAATADGVSTSFGASTVLVPLDDFLRCGSRGNDDDDEKVGVTSSSLFVEGIRAYMNEVDVWFLGIVLSFAVDGTYRRQLVLCGKDGFPIDSMVHFLLEDGSLKLAEIERQDVAVAAAANGMTIRFFEQGNAKASRKQVVPILFNFFERQSF